MSPIDLQQAALTAMISGDHTFVSRLLDDDGFWQQHEAAVAALEREEQAKKAAHAAELRARRLCDIPEQYRGEFDPGRCSLPSSVIKACREWRHASGQGLGLIGSTGMGKTRLLVRCMTLLDCSWLYLPASRFARAVRQQYDGDYGVANRACEVLTDSRKVRVLLLDDLGKESPTEAVSEALFDLIDHRTSRSLPILWTCNLNGEELEERHKSRGAAMVRRLREFSIMPV